LVSNTDLESLVAKRHVSAVAWLFRQPIKNIGPVKGLRLVLLKGFNAIATCKKKKYQEPAGARVLTPWLISLGELLGSI